MPELSRLPRWRPTLCLLAAAAVCSWPSLASAQWKWRDASGRITISDRPPPRDVADKDILQRPGAPRPTAAAAVSEAPASTASAATTTAAASRPAGDKELEARRRAAEAQQQAKAKAEEERNAAIRAENCKRARNHLATLETGQRLARLNDKGEREVLDDRARAEETRRAREVIASECKN